MTQFMLYGLIAAILALLFILFSRADKFRKHKNNLEALAVLSSIYAFVLYIVAIAVKDPIQGIPNELITLVIIGVPTTIFYKFVNELWNAIRDIPLIKFDIKNIKEKISEIDKEIESLSPKRKRK